MGMGHGMPGKAEGPASGTLAVVIATPDSLATSGTSLEVVSRWLADPSGPLVSALVPDMARDIGVSRLPRDPRDFLEIRVEAEVGDGDLRLAISWRLRDAAILVEQEAHRRIALVGPYIATGRRPLVRLGVIADRA